MRVFIKYFIWLLSLLSLVIYYLLGTTLGHNHLGYFLEKHYSKKLNNKLEILSLNIDNYPYIEAKIEINDRATLFLKGNSDSQKIDMQYRLKGESFQWNHYLLNDPIDLRGSIRGTSTKLFVKGEGEIFHGKTIYSFIRKSSDIHDLNVLLNDINSTELLAFLQYDIEVEGRADIAIEFEHFSEFRKNGVVKISMKRAILPKLLKGEAFSLYAEVGYRDLFNDFFFEIDSDVGKLRVAHGYYNKAAGLLKAEYGLHIEDLAYFEKFLGHKYRGEFNTAGEAKYELGKLSLLGDTTSYGGLLEYDYSDENLELVFKSVSLEKLLRQLSFPALLSANLFGTASYNIKEKIILMDTKLKNTRFRRTNMTETIYKFTGVDIRKDLYNNSLFRGDYRDSVLSALLKIDNGVNHLYLRNVKMNSITNEVSANFEVFIDGQEFLGKIYGTLKDPKVSLDMGKLIRYEIHKKIQSFFGTGKSSAKQQIDQASQEVNLTKIAPKNRPFLEGFFEKSIQVK
jgi:hypothetical protein